MKRSDTKKKVWAKPEVHVLNIKKDTFTGLSYGNENVKGKGKTPTP
jgi:hypothetical protein